MVRLTLIYLVDLDPHYQPNQKIMKDLLLLVFSLFSLICTGQTREKTNEELLINKVLEEPSADEIAQVLSEIRKTDLTPSKVLIHDTISLSNSNSLYVLSHMVEGNKHYGAVIVPANSYMRRLPVIVFATGGDGMHREFDITQDFDQPAVQFPGFLGEGFDHKFIVVIPSFRGQQLIIDDKKYQSEGNISDAFGGATTDALAFLNVILKTFPQSDENRISIYGGSRGGTVALLAAARDHRIKRAIAVAAPTDMKSLYQLYPEQFKLLFFNDLLSGRITESEARNKFISISPIHFLKELPRIQLHHDKNDPFVPVEFARRFYNAMAAIEKPIELYLYDEGIHGFWSDESYWKLVQEFISPLKE